MPTTKQDVGQGLTPRKHRCIYVYMREKTYSYYTYSLKLKWTCPIDTDHSPLDTKGLTADESSIVIITPTDEQSQLNRVINVQISV